MAAELRTYALKENPHFQDTPENLVRCFIDRVRANLHIILCMSPVSAKFPERARKFPGLISGCTIDWFLTWPEEALVAVSEGFINGIDMGVNTPEAKRQLVVHMGAVHRLAVDSCEEYFQKMRRYVYQTPRSFLSFLRDYQVMYDAKVVEIDRKASSVVIGLDKLRKGAEDVEAMKVVLADEEVKLRRAEEATNVMLKKLELSSMEAKKEADAVARIKELCEVGGCEAWGDE
jgi:dynein heavy chain, axonemal